MADLMRRKPIDVDAGRDAAHRLKPTLSWYHLVALGVGAIVGTGIYTLTGIAAGLAGPGVMLSFVIAGAVCACAALAYAEMATLIPQAGSAYTYTYAVLGELLAWIVGWSLILEYTVVCSTVAVGWSAHFTEFLQTNGINPPEALLFGPGGGPHHGGFLNLPAVAISLIVAGLLSAGTRESATVNLVLVILKIAALVVFVALAAPAFTAAHFHPFMPYGFFAHPHGDRNFGVMGAAALIFFAFYGFDAVSTAAEETKKPGRDLAIGIVGSMVACTLIYMAVAAAAIGASPVGEFASNGAPLVFILNALRHPLAATVVAGAAVVALPTVILAFMYGQSRIFFVMARDGLLPRALSKVSSRTHTPVTMTWVTGVIVAILAGLLPLEQIALLANAGTLCAFIAVCLSMMVLRVREPNRPRVFRTPLWPIIGTLGVLGCLYLFTSLPLFTIGWFFAWNGAGLAIYLLFAQRSSRLAAA